MSGPKKYVLERLYPGEGIVLDLGGGSGMLRLAIESLGYRYVNLDLRPSGSGWRVIGDACRLPFAGETFQVVVSCDSLEHFQDPSAALSEVGRVLKPDGRVMVWVPFLHPFHGDDYFRFTPIGLRFLFEKAGLTLVSLDWPLWAFSVLAQGLIEVLKRSGLGWLEHPIERAAGWLDGRFASAKRGGAFAAAYLAEGKRRS